MNKKQAQELLIQNGQLVADTLRHLADNEIDSDYFAITSTNENGTEIERELVITEYARQAAGTVDELVKALEAKDKRINFLKERLAQLANFNPDWDALEAATDSLREHMEELTTARARIAELEAREVKLPGAGGVESTTIQSIKDWADGWKAYREEAIKALADAGIRINGEG